MAIKDLVLPSPNDPDVLHVLAEFDEVTAETTIEEIEMMARRIVYAVRRRANQQQAKTDV